MEGNVTAADLLNALQSAAANPATRGEGFTVQELATEAGIPASTVRRLLRPLLAGGAVRPARKVVVTMAGIRAPVPSYVLVEEGKPKP